MTAGEWRNDFFCSHFSKEQQSFCIPKIPCCEEPFGGDFAGNVQVSWLVDYTQQNQYNGFGQRVKKQEGSDTTEYFYDGTAVLYTKDKDDAVSSFNLIGAEDNILSTARPGEGDAVDFYTYTKDLRESTINVVGKDGISQKTYSSTWKAMAGPMHLIWRSVIKSDWKTERQALSKRRSTLHWTTRSPSTTSKSKTSTHTMYLSRRCWYIILVQRRQRIRRLRRAVAMFLLIKPLEIVDPFRIQHHMIRNF